MTRNGLIGHTGFVGGRLARAASWDACYNSSNVADLAGQSFDLLVCAGVSAVKWLANKEPEADRAGIVRLTDALGQAKARELVLISTIDVYPDPAAGGNEYTVIDSAANHAYGRHRLGLERWAAERFETLRIVRLPALFGSGLRKNAIFDLLHGNMVDSINPAGMFQWYPLQDLWQDIATVRAHDLGLVNLFSEPVRMSRIIDALFMGAPVGPERLPGPVYDVRTCHGALFGGDEHYIMNADSVLDAIATFVGSERAA
jgi:nucleoside-diphosphate-sugar epimerase